MDPIAIPPGESRVVGDVTITNRSPVTLYVGEEEPLTFRAEEDTQEIAFDVAFATARPIAGSDDLMILNYSVHDSTGG